MARLTGDQLPEWARLEAVEVTDRAELLDAAAVGLTQLGWRNTELESQHGSMLDVEGERRDVWTRQLRELALGLRDVGDPAEQQRLDVLAEARRAGYGIPDDVMMRANIATCLAVRATLEDTIPDIDADALSDGVDEDGLPDWLYAVYDVLAEPSRPMQIGGGSLTAAELLAAGWDRYFDDVGRKLTRVYTFSDLIGPQRALWLVALSGVTYSASWHPSHLWPAAVRDLRARVVAGDLEQTTWYPKGPQPDPADDAFWDALSTQPHLLNGAQADWVTTSRLGEAMRAAREAERSRRGVDPQADRFFGLAGLF